MTEQSLFSKWWERQTCYAILQKRAFHCIQHNWKHTKHNVHHLLISKMPVYLYIYIYIYIYIFFSRMVSQTPHLFPPTSELNPCTPEPLVSFHNWGENHVTLTRVSLSHTHIHTQFLELAHCIGLQPYLSKWSDIHSILGNASVSVFLSAYTLLMSMAIALSRTSSEASSFTGMTEYWEEEKDIKMSCIMCICECFRGKKTGRDRKGNSCVRGPWHQHVYGWQLTLAGTT